MNDTTVPAQSPHVPSSIAGGPSIGLALGGGGARGLAHIPILEAFDELGIRPKVIAGTSIGAIFAAAYASGLSGKQIRAHTYEVLKKRLDLVRDLYSARVRNKGGFLTALAPRPAFLSAEKLLDIVLPPRIPRDFSNLTIPLKIVASDFYAQESVVFSSGALRPAVAASMALPVIFQPMVIDGRVLIDGGLVNPLPFDIISDEADLTVAIDASGAPVRRPGQAIPKAWETLFAANFIFERSIIREKLRTSQPDLYIDAGTSRFQILDFLKIDEILAAAEPAKERVKAQLARLIEAETLPAAEPVEALPPPSASRPRLRRPILKRRRPAKG